jgi:5'-nucleotidase
MHILLTNDDGISAYGLSVLERLARPFASKITIVAPAENQSGTGRSISLHKDIPFHKVDDYRYQVGGTPAACVMMAINVLFKQDKPDLVLSGVNHGMNVGDDVGYSGTVGAAFEAAINMVPAIALSQQHARTEVDFEPALSYGGRALEYALSLTIPQRAVLNINMPGKNNGPVNGIRKASLDTHKFCDEIMDGTQPDTYRIGPLVTIPEMLEHSDRYWLERGFISMSMLTMDANDSVHTNKLEDADF